MKNYKVTGKLVLEMSVTSTVIASDQFNSFEEVLRYYEKLGFKVISYNLYAQYMSIH